MAAVSQIPTMEQCELVASILKNLSHPQRLSILCNLYDTPKTVGELEEATGASQSMVSQFLSRMKSEGLVKSHRDAQYMVYEIANADVKKLIQALHRIFL